VLNGEKGTGDSSFKTLNTSTVPYRVFGLVNICDAEKVRRVYDGLFSQKQISHSDIAM